MRIGYPPLLLLLLTTAAACFSVKHNGEEGVLSAAALEPIGRYELDENKNLHLISSGAHFGFTFTGLECEIMVSVPTGSQHNYLQYEVDGQYRQRVKVVPGAVQSITIQVPKAGRHTISIYKATEAHTGAVIINRIRGNAVQPQSLPQKLIIEFIGNSITCGAAADASEIPCGAGAYHDQHNAYYAYGPRVARALGASFILNSVSGIGIYRNWNSDGPAMPQVYSNLYFQENNSKEWNTNAFRPQVISIALGTNDFSNGDGKRERKPFDSAQFVKAYVQFVQQVKAKRGEAQIALLSSPMVHGSNAVLLQNCLEAIKREIDDLFPTQKPVALFFFKPMQARGCTGHPSVEDHALLAADVLTFFRKLVE